MACYENTKSDTTNYDDGSERKYMGDSLMDKAVLVVGYLMKYGGYTKFQAAAMAGVAAQESGFKTYAKNPSTDAVGLYQWIPDYHKYLFQCAGWPLNTVISKLSLEEQVKLECDFLKSNCYSKVNILLKSTGNLKDACCVFGSFNVVPGKLQNLTGFKRVPTQTEAGDMLKRAGFKNGNEAWNAYWSYCKQVWSKVNN